MKETTRRLILLLAALSLLVGFSTIASAGDDTPTEVAQDEKAEGGEAEAGDAEAGDAEAGDAEAGDAEEGGGDAEEGGGDAEEGGVDEKVEEGGEPTPDAPPAPELSEEELSYVEMAGTVACYREQTKDPAMAAKEIEYYLTSVKGTTLDAYEEMRKTHAAKDTVQEAIKAEMELCPSRVLDRPEETEEKPEDKKPSFSYNKRLYTGSISGSGISGGAFSMRFKKDGKGASGNFKGAIGGQKFAIAISGTRSGKKINMSGRSGNDNISCTIVLSGKKASASCSGKVRGRNVSTRTNASSK